MQNIPSGSAYGSLIKECFQAPDGWIFVGADSNSLEDKISALITQDKNKLAVYVDGYDSHSLRAYYYWKDKFPDIRQVSDERSFKVNDTYFLASDVITYQGNSYTGLEFYNTFYHKE